jgi:photosystem II stability/assembly factor-like uncharacterized protein
MPANEKAMKINLLIRSLLFATLIIQPVGTLVFANNPAANAASFTDWQVVGPNGGDVRSIAVDPKDSDKLFITTLDGQVYSSPDAGKSWKLMAALKSMQLVLDQLIIDPRDSNVIYVSGHRNQMPGGFFKSTDGGITWKESSLLKGEAIHAMTQSKYEPSVMLIGTKTGVFRSTDSGENWTKLASTTMPTDANSMQFDPENYSTMYVGTTWRPYKSTDAGKTWKLIKDGMIDDSDVFAIDIDQFDSNRVIASACSGIYISDNKGEKWRKAQGIPSTSRRTRAIIFHPSKKGTVYAGTTEGFWMSSDGGVTWGLTTTRALEINSIAVHPDRPDRVFIGTNNYGVMVSNDGGKSFAQANGNFSSRFTWRMKADIQKPNRIYANTTNTATGGGFVFISDDSGKTWTPSTKNLTVSTDATNTLLQDKQNPNIIYLGSNKGVYRSMDRGASWNKLAAGKVPATKKPTAKGKTVAKTPAKPAASAKKVAAITENVNFLAYTNDGRNGMLAATDSGLYRTYDVAAGWEKIWEKSLPSALAGKKSYERVFSVAVSPLNPSRIVLGTVRSGLLISEDSGKTWVESKDIPVTMPISTIEFDPQNAENVFVGTVQTFYLSKNGGVNFVRRGGNLPLGNYNSILINPQNSNEVIVGSSLESNGGIYQSLDGGMNWKRLDGKDMNLPTRRVWTMMFDPTNPNRIFAGTHSSGIYKIERGATTASAGSETRTRVVANQ